MADARIVMNAPSQSGRCIGRPEIARSPGTALGSPPGATVMLAPASVVDVAIVELDPSGRLGRGCGDVVSGGLVSDRRDVGGGKLTADVELAGEVD
jgi:hypothetical protein